MTTYRNLCEFLSEELEELNRRAKEKKLTNTELEYGDKVAGLAYHLKKLEKEEEGTSERGYYDGGAERSYYDARPRSEAGGRMSGRSYRGGSGRSMRSYAGHNSEMKTLIEDMIEKAPDEHTRREMENLLFKIEEMN